VKVYFVTSNKNKFREFKRILGKDLKIELRQVKLALDEIQAIKVREVVKHKAKEAFKKLKKPVIVEDTGLYFDEWNGLPGALAKWFDRAIGYRNLCSLLRKNRKATAETVIGFFDGKNYREFKGRVRGRISKKPQGTTNFGWDIIFIPEGYKETFAAMGEKKHEISMRKIAVEKLKRFLKRIS